MKLLPFGSSLRVLARSLRVLARSLRVLAGRVLAWRATTVGVTRSLRREQALVDDAREVLGSSWTSRGARPGFCKHPSHLSHYRYLSCCRYLSCRRCLTPVSENSQSTQPRRPPGGVRRRSHPSSAGSTPPGENPSSCSRAASPFTGGTRRMPRPLRSGRKPTLDETHHARWQGRLPTLYINFIRQQT
jgi:hypothetical protein